MVQLVMLRENLEDLPPLPALPEGFSLRLATPGDAPELAALLAAAFDDPSWTVERVMSALLAAADVDRTYVIVADGELVATTSCQCGDRSKPRGTIHWVGADPSRKGLRLGRTAVLAALHGFRELGYEDANLTTDDARLPAIKTYLDLDFRPLMTDPSHSERWTTVLGQLGYVL